MYLKGMSQDFLNLISEKNNELYSVMTDDIDSLVSCNYLSKNYGIPVGGYYSFSEWRISTEIVNGKRNVPIFVDADISYPYFCVGNHTRMTENSNCFNLNNNIKSHNYTNKFICSTYYTILWLTKLKAYHKMSYEQKCFLIACDGMYLQYFKFNNMWNFWMNYCDTNDLTDIVKTKTYNEWEQLCHSDNFASKIHIKNNKFTSNINIKKINSKFNTNLVIPNISLDCVFQKFNIIESKEPSYSKDVFSGAQTFRNRFRYSVISTKY